MGTILIDKLLSACVKQGASDLHITVGQPPVLRLHGRMQKLKTKVLEPADTLALMKSITPDRCQQELQETGSSRLRLRLRRRGPLPRLDLPAARQRRDGAAADSHQDVVDGGAGRAAGLQEPHHAAARAGDRHRADRLGQDDVAGRRWSTTSTRTIDHHIITIEDPIEF